jgi:hypothetical protein
MAFFYLGASCSSVGRDSTSREHGGRARSGIGDCAALGGRFNRTARREDGGRSGERRWARERGERERESKLGEGEGGPVVQFIEGKRGEERAPGGRETTGHHHTIDGHQWWSSLREREGETGEEKRAVSGAGQQTGAARGATAGARRASGACVLAAAAGEGRERERGEGPGGAHMAWRGRGGLGGWPTRPQLAKMAGMARVSNFSFFLLYLKM